MRRRTIVVARVGASRDRCDARDRRRGCNLPDGLVEALPRRGPGRVGCALSPSHDASREEVEEDREDRASRRPSRCTSRPRPRPRSGSPFRSDGRAGWARWGRACRESVVRTNRRCCRLAKAAFTHQPFDALLCSPGRRVPAAPDARGGFRRCPPTALVATPISVASRASVDLRADAGRLKSWYPLGETLSTLHIALGKVPASRR